MVALAVVVCTPAVPAAGSAIVNTYVSDPLSGAAIGGYDPVSYFTDGEPLPGRPEFEYWWEGLPWYFANAANRDVFLRNPEIYAPAFGGYGVMALSRGYLSAGNPRISLVTAGQLFLFHSTANRDAFVISQRAAYEKALQNWGELSEELIAPSDQ